MNAATRPEQVAIDGTQAADADANTHMIARVSAVAVKIVFPFIPKNDVRYYLNGINIRPLADGSAMIIATDGHRYIVVRDPNGFAERELIIGISKDALKHAASAKHTLDVMSNGSTMILGDVAQALFIQPGNSIIEGEFPRIERVASLKGYHEGISGQINPKYLNDALVIGKSFGDSIRFFTKDDTSPLTFILGGLGDLECFGGIMKRTDSAGALPDWFPAPGAVNSLADI
jgi:DNA polymerase III sliding clamp (beta) subunit (PCNA family)